MDSIIYRIGDVNTQIYRMWITRLCVHIEERCIMIDMQEVNNIFILKIKRAAPFEAVPLTGVTHFLHTGAALLVFNSPLVQ
jgi:hypothetical protein